MWFRHEQRLQLILYRPGYSYYRFSNAAPVRFRYFWGDLAQLHGRDNLCLNWTVFCVESDQDESMVMLCSIIRFMFDAAQPGESINKSKTGQSATGGL